MNIKDDIHVVNINLDEDRNELTKTSPYTVYQICDHKDRTPGTEMPRVQDLVVKKPKGGTGHQS